jgi:hypothetical protein
MANTPNYEINLNDKRFTQVSTDKEAALTENEKTYDNMINASDAFYQRQAAAAKQYADQQSRIQQQQTDFAIEKIEQQKEQTKKDYLKEQSGAYVDWQKQSNPYGANAEQMAAQGMQDSGYSESSQVSMYNTYQIRVATAREAFSRAILNYDNAIKDARLQNSAKLAEIAYNALQKQLELSLEGFQYKNNLIIQKSDKAMQIDEVYHGRWQDVLQQINHENQMKETVRQHEADEAYRKQQLELQKAQLAEEKRQFNETMAYNKSKSSGGSSRSSGGSSGGSKKKSSGGSVKKTSGGGSVSGNKKVKSDSKQPTVDTKSVLALGFGPISGSRLVELEKSGVITSYVSNGKVKYKKSPNALRQTQLFG